MIAPLIDRDAVLDRMVRTIVERFHPLRIALFGRRARGDAHDDSDYVLMVIVERAETGLQMAIHAAIVDIASVDVVVRTAAQFEENRDDVGTLVYVVEHEGRIVYGPELAPMRVRERPLGRPRSLVSWLRRVDSDFKVVDDLLKSPDPVWDAICFHAHQGVEKLLKCVLIAGHTPPPRIHDLNELLGMCPRELRDNAALRGACAFLYVLWPQTRYPEDETEVFAEDAPEPTAEQGAEAVAHARAAREILMSALG
jgi:HEPN domain-containing protein/predicted nucleotidyltransferase